MRQVTISSCQRVVRTFQSTKLVLKSTSSNPIGVLVSRAWFIAVWRYDVRVESRFTEPPGRVYDQGFSRTLVCDRLVPFIC